MNEAVKRDEYRELELKYKAEIETLKAKHAEEIRQMTEQIEVLKRAVAILTEKIELLEANKNKNSKNSDKPPSSDGLKKAPATKSMREKTGRTTGGQKGHAGNTLELVDNPDRVVELVPIERCDCGGQIIVNMDDMIVRQVTDIEMPKKIVIEYHAYDGHCEKCGRIHKASFPSGVDATATYGENVTTTVSYMNTYQMVPLKRTTEMMRDIFGVDVSQGTVIKANETVYGQLGSTLEHIKDELINSEVVNFDETGWRVNGSLQWLHSAGTNEATLYKVHKNRGKDGMDAMGVLPMFKGTAVHDHWKAYYRYACAHAECNGHHLRHLIFLFETLKQEWAGEMICLLMRIKRHIDLCKVFGITKLDSDDIREYERIYRETLKSAAISLGMENPYNAITTITGTEMEGKETTKANVNSDVAIVEAINKKRKKTEPERMIARMAKYEQESLMFMYDFTVPFDNNAAERDNRMPKLKTKISGCFRTEEGAEIFAGIRSYISTMVKKGKNLHEGIKASLRGKALEYLYPDTT